MIIYINIINISDYDAIYTGTTRCRIGSTRCPSCLRETIAPVSETVQLTSADVDALKASKPRPKRNHAEKKAFADRYGMNNYIKYVSLV